MLHFLLPGLCPFSEMREVLTIRRENFYLRHLETRGKGEGREGEREKGEREKKKEEDGESRGLRRQK